MSFISQTTEHIPHWCFRADIIRVIFRHNEHILSRFIFLQGETMSDNVRLKDHLVDRWIFSKTIRLRDWPTRLQTADIGWPPHIDTIYANIWQVVQTKPGCYTLRVRNTILNYRYFCAQSVYSGVYTVIQVSRTYNNNNWLIIRPLASRLWIQYKNVFSKGAYVARSINNRHSK